MIYAIIFILTLADCLLTLWGVTSNQITEGNPLFVKLLSWNPVIGVIIVFSVVTLLIFFISKYKFRWLKPAALGLLGVKIFVMFLHMGWMI